MRCGHSLVFAIAIAAHAPAPAAADTECQIFLDAVRVPAPRFEDYPAKAERIAHPARVDLNSDPGAREFRTTLKRATQQGVNFAGHFSIATFGCGAGSVCWKIVDVRSGRVFSAKPAEISADNVGEKQPRAPKGVTDLLWMRFRADSALLVLMGAPDEDESAEGVTYYRWTGERFELVKRIAADKACRNVQIGAATQ